MSLLYEPTITTINTSLLPPPPKGFEYSNLLNPLDPRSGDLTQYPILTIYPNYTYVVVSATDGSPQMGIWETGPSGPVGLLLPRSGARNIWQIGYDPLYGVFTFFGEGMNFVTANVHQLWGYPEASPGPMRSLTTASTENILTDKPGCEDDKVIQASLGKSGVRVTVHVPLKL
ncbi:hypothetical protein BDN72DRAFT_944069 [Pluteus cervinus]|uniref:Uncharacterized protein n=1 Tax=Pluteus cervinus TaxID=181527 RepID=A0ACD3A1W8_9AGAR|nr:hypothetical protein BDN72DRAFT_944069 [Pluteus cervinus]